ncbi:MAG: transketolase [Kiritimatiellia bacterium]
MSKVNSEDMVLAANTLRCLAADEVQTAKSGHPGVALGLADVTAVLWLKFLKLWHGDEKWADRDRFVLSGGHGSSLLYALLHLSGYPLSIDDLKQFRQLGSRTPGHPEYGIVPGVETTTGPLGQGIAAGVGMAIAERMLAARFNTAASTLVDHRTWITCGDGDLEEGISHEAASLAGTLGLNKLVLLYDSNRITIEGRTDLAMVDNPQKRFESYGWKVLSCDGHNPADIEKVLKKAVKSEDKPVFIICHTTIGKGSPNKADSAGCHGSPLGDEELRLTKQALGFNADAFFAVPEETRQLFADRAKKMRRVHTQWNRIKKETFKANPALKEVWDSYYNDSLPNLSTLMPTWEVAKPVSTRVASGHVLNAIAPQIPQLVGGSADLAPSTMTYLNAFEAIKAGSFAGRNFHFGIRELGMAGVMNGIAVHGGLRVYGSTFFVFCDYCRPVIRVAALMGVPVIYVFTHDSFHVGEDGPTHEPVEQLPALRAMPNLCVLRPADATETAASWSIALRRKEGPTALLLSRQNLPVLNRAIYPSVDHVAQGAYVLWQKDLTKTPEAILIASGSEVSLALETAQASGRNIRVVSMPSWDLFEKQTATYRESVFPVTVTKRIAIEAASPFGWERYIGATGITLTMSGFGASGPANKLAEHFGFTSAHLTEMLTTYLSK